MVTIKDISKACGVSPATVSKALNGYSDIGSETAERIRRTAQEMHYMPNAAARQLKTNASHNIGVVFEDETHSGLTHEYFSQILNSAKNELEELGYDITFISSKIGGNSFLEHCRYRKCDGVLIASVDFHSQQVKELVHSEIPVVTIDYSFDRHSCVMSDNNVGTYELVRYLYRMGHRRIAYIHGEDTLVTRKRISGFHRACAELGLDIPYQYVLEGTFHDPMKSRECTRELMSLDPRPTAILYPDDYSYIGGRVELEKMGLKVPNDVSVAGYDGINLSQVIRPRLTTWYQDAVRIGQEAAKKLIDVIEKKQEAEVEEIEVHGRLIEGKSVRDINGLNI
jgi:DNA-binding LacI/PurR family transcriptional regulator